MTDLRTIVQHWYDTAYTPSSDDLARALSFECSTCHRLFTGASTFDRHRRGHWEHRRCANPASKDGGSMTQDPFGAWGYPA